MLFMNCLLVQVIALFHLSCQALIFAGGIRVLRIAQSIGKAANDCDQGPKVLHPCSVRQAYVILIYRTRFVEGSEACGGKSGKTSRRP